MKNILNHLDFKFNIPAIISLIIMLLILPCCLYLPHEYGYENGLLENLQMVVLFLAIVFSAKAKNYKGFFKCLILFLIIIILREVNCGRTLFFAIPGEVNSFYSWKDIKYGFLVNKIYGTFIAFSFLFFIIKKYYLDLWKMISKTKLPIWNILFFILGVILSMYAEKVVKLDVFEEISELLMYTSACGLIYLYAFDKNRA